MVGESVLNVDCNKGAVLVPPRVVALRAMVWCALRGIRLVLLMRHSSSPQSSSSIHVVPEAMSSVVAEFGIAGISATLGIASHPQGVTSASNAQAVSTGGVDVVAKCDVSRRSATPTTPYVLPALLVGRDGGVDADAEAEQRCKSAAPTPSAPISVDVAAYIGGSINPATTTKLGAHLSTAVVDVDAKPGSSIRTATPTSDLIRMPFATAAKGDFASFISLTSFVEAARLLAPPFVLTPSFPGSRWEEAQAWAGEQA